MSRYIDAEVLKSAIRTEFKELNARIAINGIINEQPSIDIVRCKECKHNYNTAINHGKMQPRCDFMDAKLKADDFCSYGERRE